jgi:FAD/FMN-containing dehydrogenase
MTTTTDRMGLEELRPLIRGTILTPDDDGYDEARAVYNAMIDRHPALIVQCRDAADVVACVRYAVDRGLDLAVRGEGTTPAGSGSRTARSSSTCATCTA